MDAQALEAWQVLPQYAQSPIDIMPAQVVPADPQESQGLFLTHTMASLDLVDNGHVAEIKATGPGVMIRGRYFALEQLHFHGRSEHTINGVYYPLESHFIFKARDGRLAAIGVLYQEGVDNPQIEDVIHTLDDDVSGDLEATDIAALLPEDKSYFHYLGSLTTSPSSDSVEWYVMVKTISLSGRQIELLQTHYSHANRQIQPLNGRPVIYGRSSYIDNSPAILQSRQGNY
ncbi:carbonic anhydrase family protein [Pseudomonas fluorescens]|uniref:carbonic anhydrase family protein n=1 Tax=Pseudomonas fluorescens TaxID=294 RepID=UPI001A9EFFCD|nr:carbonic anhydrase family protein [Pseudomonas fluorescens]QTD31471.1 carbonic anhydrase family protein [Pseudomonas fluorescens]